MMASRLKRSKSRLVDLRQGETFGFLGFDFRRVRSLRGIWRAQVTPKLTQRTAVLGKLMEVFRRYQSQPVGRVIAEINPILRGWVNYFRIGNASRCLAYVRLWVEQRVRRHLMRARGRRGFGWKRWSTAGSMNGSGSSETIGFAIGPRPKALLVDRSHNP